MATTQNTFNGNGSNLGPFSFTFKWLESTDIKVSVGGVLKTAGTHYNLQGLNYTTKTGGQVLFTAGNAPPVGTNNIRIYRDTDDEALSAVFSSGSAIRAKDLNDNFTQNLYVTQEINNNALNIDGSNPMVGPLNMNGFQIDNLAAPTSNTDAATKQYVDNIAISGLPNIIPSANVVFTQAGTGAVQRTVESKLQDVVSVKDFGAVGDGARINQALAANGGLVFVPEDSYTLEVNVTPTTGGLLIDPGATFDYYDRLKPRGSNSNLGNGVNVWRFQDRVFVGGATTVSPTTTPYLNGFDIAGDPSGLNSDYTERSAALISSSAYGGTGGVFGAKQSRQYSSRGYSVWAPGQAVSIGDKRGYNGNLFTATTSGTTGATPPSHTSGTASDGGVTWQGDGPCWMVPIGLAAFADSDVNDGHSCWALYVEGLRRNNAGTVLTTEIAVKNKGTFVLNNPYNVLAAGSTIGIWFAGGGDATLGAPAAASTAAMVIGKNAAEWGRGIVFQNTALTAENVAIAFAKDHTITWYASDENRKAGISSSRPASASGVSGIEFAEFGTFLSVSGGLTVSVEGSASNNTWLRIQGGTGNTSMLPGSAAANAELILAGKGTGEVVTSSTLKLNAPLKFAYSGFTLATTPSNFTADRYMVVYDSGGTAFYIPARLATW